MINYYIQVSRSLFYGGDLQWQRRKASYAVAAQESPPANAAAHKKVKELLGI